MTNSIRVQTPLDYGCEIGLTFRHCASCFAVLPFEPGFVWTDEDHHGKPVWTYIHQCQECGQLQDFSGQVRHSLVTRPA